MSISENAIDGLALNPANAAFGSARVLVIDEEELDGKELEEPLNEEGVEVVNAATIDTGMELLHARPFEVAVVALRLPRRDGLQTITALKGVDPDIEVVVLTRYPTLESAVAALRQGACDYLLKPRCAARTRGRGDVPQSSCARLTRGAARSPIWERRWTIPNESC